MTEELDEPKRKFRGARKPGKRRVAPLIAPNRLPQFDRLMPEINVNGSRYVVDVTNIGAVPARLLENSVANAGGSRYHIIATLDLVFTGI